MAPISFRTKAVWPRGLERWCCDPESGGPGFKASILPQAGFVSWESGVQILGHALLIANWSASCQ